MAVKVVGRRNTDRFLKCRSCRSMAAYVLSVPDVEVTVIYPPVAAGLKDETVTRSWSVSTCERHAQLNLKRAQKAEPVTIDRRPDKEN
jgi:hypothetical protein